jgi:hypothetical protein
MIDERLDHCDEIFSRVGLEQIAASPGFQQLSEQPKTLI